MHPRFVKAVARDIKHSETTNKKIREAAIEKVATRATEAPPPAQMGWAQALVRDFGRYEEKIDEAIKEYNKDKHESQKADLDKSERDELVSSYLLAVLWRDLNLAARLKGTASTATARQLDELKRALEEIPSYPINVKLPLSEYISARSQPYARQLSYVDEDLSGGDTARFHREAVDDLIDDLRGENQKGPFDILAKPLRNLAPVHNYFSGIAEIEALLVRTQHQQHLYQLAHSLQVWMLGAWMLEQKLDDKETLRDHILELIFNYFDEGPGKTPAAVQLGESLREKGTSLRAKWGDQPQLVDLFWGLIAATHDVALPLQSFQDWAKSFFSKYFGDQSFARVDVLPALLDVFHHPRFPFYKSAITNHYGSQKRNWLESIFHLDLSSRIDHALAGSLLLMREIEPEDVYTGDGIWKKVTQYLEKLSDENRPELGLVVPAYLSHAIAFTHLPDMRWRWKKEHGPKGDADEERRRGIPPEPPYFATTAENFNISFREFPLTYLLALCEVLLDTQEDAWLAQYPGKSRLRPATPDQLSNSGVSPFYISGIEVRPGNPPQLILDLSLWENNLSAEGEIICYRNELTNLINDFEDPRHAPPSWAVYHAADYINEIPTRRIIHPNKGWCDVIVNEGKVNEGTERRLRQATYHLLKMNLRIKEFKKTYICDVLRFGVRFQNVKVQDGNDERDLIYIG